MGVIRKVGSVETSQAASEGQHETGAAAEPGVSPSSNGPATPETLHTHETAPTESPSPITRQEDGSIRQANDERYRVARRRVKALIVTALVIVAVLIALLAVSCMAGGSHRSTDGSTTQDIETPSSVQTSKSTRPSKDGFNESANATMTIGGIKFQVPSYFKESSSSTDTNKVAYAETGGRLAMLSTGASDSEGASEKDFYARQQEYMDSFVSGIGNSVTVNDVSKAERTTIAGLPAFRFAVEMTVQGVRGTYDIIVFLNEQIGNDGYVSLAQTDNTAYDYAPDFEKIVTTATSVTTGEAPTDDTAEPQQDATTGGVSADVKEALDSYEAFIDEYVAFMQRYNDSGDTTGMMMDYLSYLQRLSDLEQKIDALDDNGMSDADLAYYTEVTLRCAQKLSAATR